MIIAADYLHDIINHPSWPAAIAIAVVALAVVGVVWAFAWFLKG